MHRKFKQTDDSIIFIILIISLLLFVIFVSTIGVKNTIAEREFNKKYCVVSCFNETILETNDRSKAYETAYFLTMMSKNFSLRSYYFVLEKDFSLNKDF